jgi:hypothetical protein
MSKSGIRLLACAALGVTLWAPAAGHTADTRIVGYGQHTEGPTKVLMLPSGPLVVGPLTASFSVTDNSAMCAVGEAGGQGAPFNMLVYAKEITSRSDGPDGATITLSGIARSITMVAGAIVEDVDTPFSATAHDAKLAPSPTGDFFHISIDTSLWPHTTFGKDLDGNPLPLFAGNVAIDHPVSDPF